MSPLEVAGFVTGAMCVWLAVRQNVWTFPLGIANTAIFLVLFMQNGLYANACLQIIFLGLSAMGWYWWVRGDGDNEPLRVNRGSHATPALALAAFIALSAVIMLILATWTDSEVVFWDAATTASSIVAQQLLNRKIASTWWWWMATDVALIALYASQGLRLTAVLYVLLLGMCVAGSREWRLSLNASREPAAL